MLERESHCLIGSACWPVFVAVMALTAACVSPRHLLCDERPAAVMAQRLPTPIIGLGYDHAGDDQSTTVDISDDHSLAPGGGRAGGGYGTDQRSAQQKDDGGFLVSSPVLFELCYPVAVDAGTRVIAS
jgi:hypothetical protein